MNILTVLALLFVFNLPIISSPGNSILAGFHADALPFSVFASGGQYTGQENSGSQDLRPDKKRAKPEAKTQTFTGTVEWEYKPLSWDCQVPNCDHYALYDDATHSNYELDDARAALHLRAREPR